MLALSKTPLPLTKAWKMGFQLSLARFWPLFWMLLVFQTLPSTFLMKRMLSTNQKDMAFYLYDIAFWLVSLVLIATVVHQQGTLLQGNPSKFLTSLKLAFRKFPFVLLLVIANLLLVLLGLVALILPGIFLTIAVSCAFPIIILENNKIMDAIKESIRLVWGHWWRTVAVIFLPIFFAILIGFIIGVVIVSGLFLLHFSPEHIDFITDVLVGLFDTYWVILIWALQIVQWQDLKLRYEMKQKD
jgi:ABC-type methionine transport system permease subunit